LCFYEAYAGLFWTRGVNLYFRLRKIGSWYFFCLWTLMGTLPPRMINYRDLWKSQVSSVIYFKMGPWDGVSWVQDGRERTSLCSLHLLWVMLFG
jgi:hypothetical protein